MPFRKPAPVQKEVTLRKLKDIDVEKFQNDILQSSLITNPPDDVTELIDQYNSTLSTILDAHAPARTKKITITSLHGIQRTSERQRSSVVRQRESGELQD